MSSKILQRVERDAGIDDLAAILGELPGNDLHSLLLAVFRRRASRRTPIAVLEQFSTHRWLRPYASDPVLLLECDRVAFAHACPSFEAIDLAPICPLGTTSVIAPVNQNNVLTTARSFEVVSDASAVLALECASRRRAALKSATATREVVRLCTSHRVLRCQVYRNPELSPHFRLFALCTAGRGTPDKRFEIETLLTHVRTHVAIVRATVGSGVTLRVVLSVRQERPSESHWQRELVEPLGRDLPDIAIEWDRKGLRGEYYVDVAFRVYGAVGGKEWVLAAGGWVDWAQRLLANARERLFTSGLATEHICALMTPHTETRGASAPVGVRAEQPGGRNDLESLDR